MRVLVAVICVAVSSWSGAQRGQSATTPETKPASAAVTAIAVWLSTGPNREEAARYAKFEGLTFVPDRKVVVRQDSNATAPVAWTMEPIEIAAIFDVTEGWLRIGSGEKRGWVSLTEDDLRLLVVKRNLKSCSNVIGEFEGQGTWSVATRHAILAGRPQIGFSLAQIVVAIGPPLKTTEEETASGLTARLVYPDREIEMKNGKVTKITTVK